MKSFAFAALAASLFLAPATAAFAQDHDAGHETAADHAEHGDDHGITVRDVVSDIGFQGALANFLLLVALFVWAGGKVMPGFLSTRKKQIEEGLADAQRLKAEAEEKFEEFSSKLEKLDEELARIREEMVKAGQSERDRIIAEAESKAARLRKDTEFIIEQQIKTLRDALLRDAVNAAVASAGEVLAKETSAADQTQLATAYVERLKTRVGDRIDNQGGA